MRIQRVAAVAAAVFVSGVALSACGGGGTSGADGVKGAAADPAALVGTCRSADLRFGNGPDDGAQAPDAPGAVVIKLTNQGDSSCVMNGFPGVRLRTNRGVLPVPHTRQTPHQVTLRPGGSTLFAIDYLPSDPGTTGVQVSTMAITLPGDTHARSLPWTYQTLLVTNGEGGTEVYPSVSPVGVHLG